MATLQETLREVIDVILHSAKIGVEEIGDHENAMARGLPHRPELLTTTMQNCRQI